MIETHLTEFLLDFILISNRYIAAIRCLSISDELSADNLIGQ